MHTTLDPLKERYKLKLKGVGPINYHLGCGYTRNEVGTLVADPRKYVEKILKSYEKPLEKNQGRPRHLWWEEITQRVTYLTFVRPGLNQTIPNNCWTTNLAFWTGEI